MNVEWLYFSKYITVFERAFHFYILKAPDTPLYISTYIFALP
jgi:hypothetical protein